MLWFDFWIFFCIRTLIFLNFHTFIQFVPIWSRSNGRWFYLFQKVFWRNGIQFVIRMIFVVQTNGNLNPAEAALILLTSTSEAFRAALSANSLRFILDLYQLDVSIHMLKPWTHRELPVGA